MEVSRARWLDLPDVQAQVNEATALLTEMIRQDWPRRLHSEPRMASCESPIEAIFLIWWQTWAKLIAYACAPNKMPSINELTLVPQYEIEVPGRRYRVDFALIERRVAIELDGHEFHERTKEQVAARNRRDRDLQVAGWRVLHISGSELLYSQGECIMSVLEAAEVLNESMENHVD